jgi:hypothetical protein
MNLCHWKNPRLLSDLNIFQTIDKSSLDTEATTISPQHPKTHQQAATNKNATALSGRRQPKRSRLSYLFVRF